MTFLLPNPAALVRHINKAKPLEYLKGNGISSKDYYIAENLFLRNMTKVVFIVSLTIILAFSVSSCKKTTQSELVNGLWEVTTVNLDTSSSNYLNKFPNFNGCGNCAYKLSFQESDVVFSYYISNDSIVHLATGTWSVPSYSKVTIKVDDFIDGTFSITRPLLTHFILTTNTNHVAEFDNGVNPQFDTCYAKIDMVKI